MKLSTHRRKGNGELYFVFHYDNDDEGFFLYRLEDTDTILYPLAVLVYPKVSGWLAKINWADFSSMDRKVVLSQTFTVADKNIAVIDDETELTPVHHALWIHCSVAIRKYHNDEQTKKVLNLPPGSPLLVIAPVWQVWREPTVKEFYEVGEELF